MDERLLTAAEAAHRLGITRATFYDWVGQSDRGLLTIRGQRTTIAYFQGGPRGQGRIKVEEQEVARIREVMRVKPLVVVPRRSQARHSFPGIVVRLGHPDRPP